MGVVLLSMRGVACGEGPWGVAVGAVLGQGNLAAPAQDWGDNAEHPCWVQCRWALSVLADVVLQSLPRGRIQAPRTDAAS